MMKSAITVLHANSHAKLSASGIFLGSIAATLHTYTKCVPESFVVASL